VIHRPITRSVRSARPVVMASDYEAANDRRIMRSNEGRNDPICDADSVIGCAVIAVLFLVVLVTAPDWWPVLVGVLR
jgi:hypothetical protein